MPVVIFPLAPIDTVNAVPCALVLSSTMAGMSSSSSRLATHGMQIRPRPFLLMKLMTSGVTICAEHTRSPSFSRSSSSTTMMMWPSCSSSIASSIVLKGISISSYSPSPSMYPPRARASSMPDCPPLRARNASTYFAMMSTSMFTLAPGLASSRVVSASVWGMIETENPPWRASTTVTDPLGTMYLATSLSTAMSNKTALPWCLRERTVPTPSTWPFTMCPPRRPSACNALSRLTAAPGRSEPRMLLARVSCMTSTVNDEPSMSTTVRQTPETAIDSPTLVPSSTRFAATLSAPAGVSSMTLPLSSIMPVNMRSSSGWICGYLQVGADSLDREYLHSTYQ